VNTEDLEYLLCYVYARAYLRLWIDFSAVLFENLGDLDLVFLSTQMHRSQAVLCSAVGVSAVVEQQSRYVCIAEWCCQMKRSVAVLQNEHTQHSVSFPIRLLQTSNYMDYEPKPENEPRIRKLEATYHRFCVGICSMLQRCCCNFSTISFCCDMQRCVTVLKQQPAYKEKCISMFKTRTGNSLF